MSQANERQLEGASLSGLSQNVQSDDIGWADNAEPASVEDMGVNQMCSCTFNHYAQRNVM